MYEEKVIAQLRQAIHDRVEAIARGAPADWGEYKRMVGEIAGMRLALQRIQDLLLDPDED